MEKVEKEDFGDYKFTQQGFLNILKDYNNVDDTEEMKRIVNYFVNLRKQEIKFNLFFCKIIQALENLKEQADIDKFLVHFLLYISMAFMEDVKRVRGSFIGKINIQKYNEQMNKSIKDLNEKKKNVLEFCVEFLDNSTKFDSFTLINYLEQIHEEPILITLLYIISNQLYTNLIQ